MSGGGVPAVSVVGQTTMAPFALHVGERDPRRALGLSSSRRSAGSARERNERRGMRIAGHDRQRRADAALKAVGEELSHRRRRLHRP